MCLAADRAHGWSICGTPVICAPEPMAPVWHRRVCPTCTASARLPHGVFRLKDGRYMANKPSSIEIRAYQVGFGDCFLVSFVYSKDDKRHVLIDFGTTELPKQLEGPSKHMPHVANHIKEVCGGKLTAVVATHRHADHISGFATDGKSGGSGTIIADCNPKVVLQPWT